jgi:hypothetical protein
MHWIRYNSIFALKAAWILDLQLKIKGKTKDFETCSGNWK